MWRREFRPSMNNVCASLAISPPFQLDAHGCMAIYPRIGLRISKERAKREVGLDTRNTIGDLVEIKDSSFSTLPQDGGPSIYSPSHDYWFTGPTAMNNWCRCQPTSTHTHEDIVMARWFHARQTCCLLKKHWLSSLGKSACLCSHRSIQER